MTVESHIIRLETRKEGEILDIRGKVRKIVENGPINDGVVFLFVPGSTAALTTIEFEPGLLADLPAMLERVDDAHTPVFPLETTCSMGASLVQVISL
jgi:thiamine phosphate synthase YjbQ (UPF0047 family)